VRVLPASAIAVLIAALLFTGWLALGAPWLPTTGPFGNFHDVRYPAGHDPGSLSLTAVLAAIALVVVIEARAGVAKRPLGAVALWTILAGDVCLQVFEGLRIWLSTAALWPADMQSPVSRYLDSFGVAGAAFTLGAALLLLGALLLVATRFADVVPRQEQIG